MLRSKKYHKSISFIKPKFNKIRILSDGENDLIITFSSKKWSIWIDGVKGKREVKSTTENNVTISDSNSFYISGDLSQITEIYSNYYSTSLDLKNLKLLPSLVHADLYDLTIGNVSNIGNMRNFTSYGVSLDNRGIYGDLSKIGNIENTLRLVNESKSAFSQLYGWLNKTNKPKTIAINSKGEINFNKYYMFNSDFASLFLLISTPLSSQSIDQILINLAASVITRNPLGNEISLVSNNKRTTNSDDAVAYLVSLGFRIIN